MANTARSPRRLGRGLASLMSTPAEVKPTAAADTPGVSAAQTAQHSGNVHSLPLEAISPNPSQPRRSFDDQSLNDLADSIRTAGLIQPVVVRPSLEKQGGYELIAGERRWRAARLAGLTALPAIVRETSDRESAEIALIENLQREDLDPIERATALRSLLDRFSLSQAQLSERIGLPRSTIANLLRLLELPEEVGGLLRAGELSLGHGKMLVSISDHHLCVRLAQRCVQVGWSVRALEREIERALSGEASSRRSAEAQPAHISDLEQRLAGHLGTKVKIRQGRKKGSGRIVIDFYDLDQFDGLMQRMGFVQE